MDCFLKAFEDLKKRTFYVCNLPETFNLEWNVLLYSVEKSAWVTLLKWSNLSRKQTKFQTQIFHRKSHTKFDGLEVSFHSQPPGQRIEYKIQNIKYKIKIQLLSLRLDVEILKTLWLVAYREGFKVEKKSVFGDANLSQCLRVTAEFHIETETSSSSIVVGIVLLLYFTVLLWMCSHWVFTSEYFSFSASLFNVFIKIK